MLEILKDLLTLPGIVALITLVGMFLLFIYQYRILKRHNFRVYLAKNLIDIMKEFVIDMHPEKPNKDIMRAYQLVGAIVFFSVYSDELELNLKCKLDSYYELLKFEDSKKEELLKAYNEVYSEGKKLMIKLFKSLG